MGDVSYDWIEGERLQKEVGEIPAFSHASSSKP